MSQIIHTQSAGPSPNAWESCRTIIERLYLNEDKTLPQVMEIMDRDYNFKASTKMYKQRLKLWEMDCKYLKKIEVKQIAHAKVARDAAGKRSAFKSKKRQIDLASVQRYLKKHGFPSLEAFDRVASPFIHEDTMVCYTPVDTSMQSYSEDTNTIQYDVELSQVDEAPITGPTIINYDRSSTIGHCDIDRCALTSPAARSRRLLLLTPVPLSPTQPSILKAPEEIFWTIRSYMSGMFDAGKWGSDASGWLVNVSDSSLIATPDLESNCKTAAKFIAQGKNFQARQVLSKVCEAIEHQTRSEKPRFIQSVLSVQSHLRRNKLHDVAAIILRHSSMSASYILGDQHPLGKLWKLFSHADEQSADITLLAMQCVTDILEREAGPLHSDTLEMQSRLLDTCCEVDAITRGHALLSMCESVCTKKDIKRILTARDLGWALYRNSDYQEAEDIMLDVQEAVMSMPYSERAGIAPMISEFLSMTSHAKGDLVAAEMYCRSGLVASVSFWGRGDATTLWYLKNHADLLRELGRLQEAEEADLEIQNILGPSDIEIVELLE